MSLVQPALDPEQISSRARLTRLTASLTIPPEKQPRQSYTSRSTHSTGSAKLRRTFAFRRGKDAAATPRYGPREPGPLQPAVPRASPETKVPDRIPSLRFSAEEKCAVRPPAGKL